MNLRTLLVTLTAVTTLATLSARPIEWFGREADLSATLQASVRHDDNIFLRPAGEVDDLVYSVAPGVKLTVGAEDAPNRLNLVLQEEFLLYGENDALDTSLSSARAAFHRDNGKTTVDGRASFAQTAQNDVTAPGAIVAKDLTNGTLKAEVEVSPRLKLGACLDYAESDYKLASYTDNRAASGALDAFWGLTAKTDLSVGYKFRQTWLGRGGIDSADHFLNIGSRGRFTEKLTGAVRLGYLFRDFERGRSTDSIGADVQLSYAYSEKTMLTLNLANDFGNSAAGDFTETTSASLAAVLRISTDFTLQASAGYRWLGYRTRDDEFLDLGLSASYALTRHFSLFAAFAYRQNHSDLATVEFDNTVYSLGANCSW